MHYFLSVEDPDSGFASGSTVGLSESLMALTNNLHPLPTRYDDIKTTQNLKRGSVMPKLPSTLLPKVLILTIWTSALGNWFLNVGSYLRQHFPKPKMPCALERMHYYSVSS